MAMRNARLEAKLIRETIRRDSDIGSFMLYMKSVNDSVKRDPYLRTQQPVGKWLIIACLALVFCLLTLAVL